MRYRLLAPVGVAGAIALGTWLPNVTSAAAATPALAPLSAQELVAKALSSHVKGFSGIVRWTANLGLPSLSALTGGVGAQGGGHAFDPTTLLSGSHDLSVWDAGPSAQRLALPGALSEVDLVHNGPNLYTFDSSTQKVTDYTGVEGAGRHAPEEATGAALTPDQAAQALLAHLGTSTTLSVITPVYVARQAAYQLVLTPNAAASTVGSVTVAVDAANGMPLRLQVFPRHPGAPALSLGFRKISFAVPGPGNFAAPHGSSTVTRPIGHAMDAGGPPAAGIPAPMGPGVASTHPTTVGAGWATIAVIPATGARATGRLDQVGSTVTGSFGTARLVSSTILNALVLPSGKVLAGFVTPAALEAAASAG